MSCDLTKPLDSGIKSLYEWKLFMVKHHLTKFVGHKYFNSRDVMVLVSHLTKQDHVIKGSGNYNDGRLS